MGAGRVPKFCEGLGFYLPYTLPGYVKRLAHFVERPWMARVKAEPKQNYFSFSVGQSSKNLV